MKDLIERLPTEPSPTDASIPLYDMATIRATATRCIDLPLGGRYAQLPGLLAVSIDAHEHVSFAVFAFAMGEATQNGVVVDGPKMDFVFSGSGPAGALRELRHTQWGDNGYLHCPSSQLIAAAFAALGEWFDV